MMLGQYGTKAAVAAGFAGIVAVLAGELLGQDWRAPGRGGQGTPRTAASESDPPSPARSQRDGSRREEINSTPTGRRTIARVTRGIDVLPNDRGQLWREYDITPYTKRVAGGDAPQQAIIDWILRETGYEAWHGEAVSVLSADRQSLRVYHHAEMQEAVAEIVDRFVNSQAERHHFGVRICTVGSPNWRTRAQRYLHPVPVQSPGVQAWLLAREDAATLLVELRRRPDYREHGSPNLLINNGQNAVFSGYRPRAYVQGLMPRRDGMPGYEPQQAQLNEGYQVELSPLISLDGRSIDAIIKCHIDQVERMVPVQMEMPGLAAGQQQWINVEVPQMTSNRLQERFHWPADKVLLVSMGVVASPVPEARLPIPLPLSNGPARADALLFLESKGPLDAPAGTQAESRAVNARGRY